MEVAAHVGGLGPRVTFVVAVADAIIGTHEKFFVVVVVDKILVVLVEFQAVELTAFALEDVVAIFGESLNGHCLTAQIAAGTFWFFGSWHRANCSRQKVNVYWTNRVYEDGAWLQLVR